MAREGEEEERVAKLVQTSSPRVQHALSRFKNRTTVEFGSPTSNSLVISTKSDSFR